MFELEDKTPCNVEPVFGGYAIPGVTPGCASLNAQIEEEVDAEYDNFVEDMGQVDIDAYNRCFDTGAEKYGLTAFMGRDCWQDLEEEMLDQLNYTKFMIVKNRRLKQTWEDLIDKNIELVLEKFKLEDQLRDVENAVFKSCCEVLSLMYAEAVDLFGLPQADLFMERVNAKFKV
jgi:hypothetical protein